MERIDDEVYEAAVIPEKWPEVLHRLSEACGGVGTVLFSNTDKDRRWLSSPTLHSRMERFISEGWVARNTRATNGFGKGVAFLPRFLTEADLYDGTEYEDDPLYKEYFIPNGMGWSAATVIALPHGDELTISVERAHAMGPVPQSALAFLDSCRPHLARSVMLAARLSFERGRAAVETLAQLGIGACSVEATGIVQLMNREFEEEAGRWTTRAHNRIALFDRGADTLLQEALATLHLGAGLRSIPLPSTDVMAAGVLHVVPLRRSARDIFVRSAAILVFTKASNKVSGAHALIQALFDLSVTESLLAAKIAAGRSVEEVASEEGKSIATVRNQMKSVLAKSGCARQVDLVRLLNRLLPPSL